MILKTHKYLHLSLPKYLLLAPIALQVLAASSASASPQVLARAAAQVLGQAPAAPNAAPEPNNWLGNGDFVRGEDGWAVPTENAVTLIVDGPRPGTKALRVNVTPAPGDNPWSISLRQELGTAIKKGDPLVLRLWARSPQNLTLGANVEAGAPGYAKSISQGIALSPEWKEYEARGVAAEDYAGGAISLVMHLGGARGQFELASLRLFNPNDPNAAGGASGASPQAPVSLVQNGDFTGDLNANWTGFGAVGDANARVQAQAFAIAPGSPVGAARGVRLSLDPASGSQPWNLRLGQVVRKFIGRDEAISVKFWARSPERVRVLSVYEMASEPHTKFISVVSKLTPEWKEYRLVGYAPRPFAPGESQFNLFLGYDKGTLEVANVRVENFGRAPSSMFSPTVDFYGGVEPDDSWRAPALARIQAIRKGDISVRVVDAKGKPISGAKVSIEQQKHGFKWGTAGPASRILGEDANSVRWRAELKKRFNTFVFESDMKWPQSQSAGDFERIGRAMVWLKANGFQHVRGHNAVWGGAQYLPAGMLDLPKEELTRQVLERTRSIVERYKGQVYVWDVVNEAATNVALWDKIGWDKFAEVYKIAKAADPKALVAYNDYNMVNEASRGAGQRALVFERIKYLQQNGAPLDVIGDQAHMSVPLTPVKRVLEIMDETARFGVPIEITEFDASVADDKVHGEYTRDFITAMFSHPKVDAFLMWGFWEGAHWLAKEGGAMIRKDWSERPSAKIWDDLLFKQWWTRVNGAADAKGTFKNRAFYGTQRISVSARGKSVSQDVELVKGGKREWVMVVR